MTQFLICHLNLQQFTDLTRGRPGLNDECIISFQITGHIASTLKARDDSSETNGLFILATNDLSEALSMQFILD